eukprot:9730261-Lingulodinium_polyedra.AAC.1
MRRSIFTHVALSLPRRARKLYRSFNNEAFHGPGFQGREKPPIVAPKTAAMPANRGLEKYGR